MSALPQVSNKKAVSYEYFPTVWQNVIWRNWGYIPVNRIADALETSCENVYCAVKQMGLDENEPLNPMWKKRGYLTTIRDNWHICTYEQIMTLLNISADELAFILKEDDFMWVKLGNEKPQVEKTVYAPLTEEQRARTREIASLCKEAFGSYKDNAFSFVEEFQKPVAEKVFSKAEGNNLRMIYPYFALYGDVLLDESLDPLPEQILKQYAQVGINGIWMQLVLYQLVEFPFDPALSKGWEKRIQSLRRLVAKAKKYGIGIYPYLNEPRSMPESFFEKYPHLRGEAEGDYYAMCTSTKEVQDYLYHGVRTLFEMVPDLAGFFTITMSENLTNCYSRLEGEMACPRCRERKPWEVVAEVNNLMAKGAHDACPNAKAVVWAWGWKDEWAEKVVPLLTEGQILQCTSEEAMQFQIGGVKGSVLDYTMSLCGPGEKAKNLWKVARKQKMPLSAKVQINNTWEMAVVPYIPVLEKVAGHIENLKAQGIKNLQMSWTLGGCPSPNLHLAAWLMEDKGNFMDFLTDWLGETVAKGVYDAQLMLSEAFSHYPFYLDTLYFGPQNYGPMAPFFLKPTGYEASMVGYPYDDVQKWAGIYPVSVYEEEYRQLITLWEKGLCALSKYQGADQQLDEMILMGQVVLRQYESAYHHIRFNRLRENRDSDGMLRVIEEEMETVFDLMKLRCMDSRIGYESSNHYFYTMQDLKEKIVNLQYCESVLRKAF